MTIYFKRWWSLRWFGKVLSLVGLPVIGLILLMFATACLMVVCFETSYFIYTGKKWAE